jgi:hypothetical protein
MGPKEAICNLLISYSVFYNPMPNEITIEAYVNKLHFDGFKPEEVKYVLDRCLSISPFFPAICEFYKIIKPIKENHDDQANLLVGKIIKAISDYGPYQTSNVKDFVGEVSWDVIENFGGWHMLCEITNDQLPATRAQLRDLAKGIVKKSSVQKNLTQLSENKLSKLDFGGLGDY